MLIAVGLAGAGGGRGRIVWTGAVEVRRRGGGRGIDGWICGVPGYISLLCPLILDGLDCC